MKRKNEQLLSEVLTEFINDRKIKQKYTQTQLKHVWNQHMGNSIVQYTKGLRLYKQSLYVKIISAPLRHELAMNKEKLIQLLNKKAGATIIRDIVFE